MIVRGFSLPTPPTLVSCGMTDPASTQYRQIVAVGVRRDVRGGALESNRSQLQRMGLYGSIQSLPELGSQSCAPYLVPPSIPAVLTHRGALRPPRRPIAHFHRLEAGEAALVAREDVATGRPIRRCTAVMWGYCARRSSERRIRRRRGSPYRSMALGQHVTTLWKKTGIRRSSTIGNGGQRLRPGLRGRKDHETDRDAHEEG